MHVLQYGVTRERLCDVLEDAEGWDVIHISGHGAPGELLLETAAGEPDRVSAAELADMLDLARERVKLVTVSACWSAAVTAAEQRRLLGLPTGDQRSAERPGRDAAGPGTVATELAERLGCAVLAMRFPVDDEFAIALSGKLYGLLAAKGQQLPRAVGMALRHLGGIGVPALSAVAPVLFGGMAADLRLPAPPRRRGEDDYDTGALKMTGFPPQPDRFVGRTGVMTRASTALAAASGVPGVFLHGIPGGGKTACALELAYGHAFGALVWYQAPGEGMDIVGALTDFALTLERGLPGFQMIHVLADDAKLAGFTPRLTELAEQKRVLIIIDNAESLLTDGGQWRDKRWAAVFSALTAHAGLGRVIVTSRRVPAATSRLRVEAVDALSADEALLLARELPHLRRLIAGQLPGIDPDVSRKLALGVLNVAQGHPKLLELAEGQAGHADQLAGLVAAGNRAWQDQGGVPEGFFAAEGTAAAPADYMGVLAAWTRAVVATLSPGERDLFWFLCCLEEPDRLPYVVDMTWPSLRKELSRQGLAPGLGEALAAIAARGLAAIQTATDAEHHAETYGIHPGIAAAGREHAGKSFQGAADSVAAAFWHVIYENASGDASNGTVDTGLLVRAGFSGVPYLVRLEHWESAAYMLERAFVRDPSRTNAVAMLPAMRQIADRYSRSQDVLALLLEAADPAESEKRMRAYLNAVLASGDYAAAAVTSGRLTGTCLATGRLPEALALAEQTIRYIQQAGLGPWSRLFGEVGRLGVLNEMGRAADVLVEVQQLRERMETLPAVPRENEVTDSWRARERLLMTGRSAADQLGRWEDAVDLNSEITASMLDRHAPAADIARARFNDYWPLLHFGQTDEALDLLLECRQVFLDAHDTEGIGNTLIAMASIENKRGHGDAAILLVRDGLRYKYLTGDVHAIETAYGNLGKYLRDHARQPAAAIACHLAAALIGALTGRGGSAFHVVDAGFDLLEFGADAVPPANVADLCLRISDIPGTDPVRLIADITPDPEAAEQMLQRLIANARTFAQDLASGEAPPSAEQG